MVYLVKNERLRAEGREEGATVQWGNGVTA
jgi:hypothetical protein